MSKKSYFLGLGIGITVTALILGISFQSRKTVMSDDEIIARAKELGMIENTVIAELEQNDAKETQTENTEPVLMDEDVSNTEEADSEETTPTVTTPVVTPAETTPVVTPVEATPVVTPSVLEGDAALMVTIVINADDRIIMSILPADPLPDQSYSYAYDASTDSYTLTACLENPSDEKAVENTD
ncbi:MAG: hypothetical protein HGA25_00195, partial [Clostridiales bacterium]|nr:hypothetical protein [Clostridiales bacterium]